MNALLNAFPEQASARLLPHLTLLEIPDGEILCETGSALNWAYFPLDALISTSHVMEDGSSVGISLIGNEGMVAWEVVMGGRAAIGQNVVVQSGFVYRLSVARLRRELIGDSDLRAAILNYEQYVLEQIIQTGACARFHHTEQRLCRFLLCMMDRLGEHEVHLTQEAIARILGVRRESVSEVASQLQAEGILHYARGQIQVLDRSCLEHRSCGCYSQMKARRSKVLEPRKAAHLASLPK